jgi:hypothetical protein
MSNFRPIGRDTALLFPPSMDEWLPQRYLARFVVDVVDGLDLSEIVRAYRGSGSMSYHPAMLLLLLLYGCATKVFSSRAIERATYDSVAFRFIAADEHPDHDTMATFRKRFLTQMRMFVNGHEWLAREDQQLFEARSNGKHHIRGFTNHDMREKLIDNQLRKTATQSVR